MMRFRLITAIVVPLLWGTFILWFTYPGALGGFGVRLPELIEPLDAMNYDVLMRYRPTPVRVDPRLVFFRIDDKTLKVLQQDPLDRPTHARMLRALHAAGALATVWDVVFVKETSDDGDFSSAIRQIPTFLAFGGRLLGAREQQKVLGVQETQFTKRFRVGPLMEVGTQTVPSLELSVRSRPDIMDAVWGAGHVARSVDRDGVCRRVPLVVRVGSVLMPSLSLGPALAVLGIPADDLVVTPGQLILGARTLDQPLRVPLDHNGYALVNYIPDWFSRIDARSYGTQLESLEEPIGEDIAAMFDDMSTGQPGSNAPSAGGVAASLESKVILIGEDLPGGSDFVPTPLEPVVPGTLVHFNVLNSLLTGQFITPASVGLVMALTLLLPASLSLVDILRWPILSTAWTALVLVSFLLSSILLFTHGSYFLPVSGPLLATGLTGVTRLAVARIHVHYEASHLATTLSRFVSPTLLREIRERGSAKILPGVQRTEVTVLFVDVAGFTSFTDRSEPEEISVFLASLYENAMIVLDRNSGTLDKFLGDGILAYFGAPDLVAEKERLAVQAALELQAGFVELREEMLSRGFPKLNIRCGLTTGYSTVGYFGGYKHAAYTVIGRQVNLASRLQSNAPPGGVVIDKHTASRVSSAFELAAMAPIKAKGIDKPVEVWQVVSPAKPGGHTGEGRKSLPVVKPVVPVHDKDRKEIFISAKSEDYEEAARVQEILRKNGKRPFFCKDLDMMEAQFQRRISKALDEVDHMVVVTSNAEHVKSRWVEFEWSTFAAEKLSGRKRGNLITITVGPVDAKDLPLTLRQFEVIPLDDDCERRVLSYLTSPEESGGQVRSGVDANPLDVAESDGQAP